MAKLYLIVTCMLLSTLVAAEPSASELLTSSKNNPIVFRPLNIIIKNNIIKKRDHQGNLCYFDTTRLNESNYFGPIGGLTYKVTSQGIYTYPDIGDQFGSGKGRTVCDMDHDKRYTETEFEAITVFDGWDGLVGCALTGCRYNDLNGYYIDDYYDYERRKYRAVANQFNPQTLISMQKTQGLGKIQGIEHANRSEYLWFSYPEEKAQTINFDGIWLETQYNSTPNPNHLCLLIKANKIWSLPSKNDQCPKQINAYSLDATEQYQDMWWLNQETHFATLAQLNTLVKWQTSETKDQYTNWEFLPTSHDWQKGILYRFKQQISVQDPTKAITLQASQLTKIITFKSR
ncbi:hypothetical protein QWZ04_04580 [Vibrio tapetis subsp. quintayensis]|uniref:hypothetical protein n=1 Tax=Vibrio tapetis TaxID=52443 RepID=UPI0025B332E4|nr:hypothetical protein [Vibrio tapetis]MDN3679605.1 hypothetical protein [Vibrio tapetis subsp. quintayensis]